MQYSVRNKIPKIVMPICDDNLFTLKLSSFLFDKFFPSETQIEVIGFKKPDFEISKKMNFVSISETQKEGALGWSKYILKYLEQIEDQEVLFLLEDFFPTTYPNMDMLSFLLETLEKNRNIGRFDLTYDSYSGGDFLRVGKMFGLDLLVKPRYSSYRISTQPSLWNKQYLMKILKKTSSPWDFEINGTKVSNSLDYQVLALGDNTYTRFPTYWIHKGAVSRHFPNKINVLGLDIATIKEMVDKNLFKEEELVWGMFSDRKSPLFEDLGGYDFDPRKMPKHEASKSNWKEYYHVYLKI